MKVPTIVLAFSLCLFFYGRTEPNRMKILCIATVVELRASAMRDYYKGGQESVFDLVILRIKSGQHSGKEIRIFIESSTDSILKAKGQTISFKISPDSLEGKKQLFLGALDDLEVSP